jgi:hypothetical protein
MTAADLDRTVAVFYRTWRAGTLRLSDGGGPFGFDIAVALIAHEIIDAFGCDAIAETGCFTGDTTAYLARRYPDLPVYTCDTDPECSAFTARRLAGCPNVIVSRENSPAMLARVCAGHRSTFAFLDAHWGRAWPLPAELEVLDGAVALIHDFDIGHQRFSYDRYGGRSCGPALLARMSHPPARYFTVNPLASLPVPCLQTGRRAGVAVITAGLDPAPLDRNPYLQARVLGAACAGAAS